MTASRTTAAAALADLFFLPGPTLSDAEKLKANELRQKYRDWRSSSSSAAPTVDVLDLNHQANTSEQRPAVSKMRRVKTVGARLEAMQPVVRSSPLTRPGRPRCLRAPRRPPPGCGRLRWPIRRPTHFFVPSRSPLSARGPARTRGPSRTRGPRSRSRRRRGGGRRGHAAPL